MTGNEYQKLALRTANMKYESEEIISSLDLLNGALGLCGESGEVADAIKKSLFQGHKLNKDKLIEELGDVAWYLAITSAAIGVDLETVFSKNIDKLKRRYPEGFTAYDSINRTE